MSRGPGRMMRAALAEVAEHESASAYSVACRAYTDRHVCDSRFPGWLCRDCEFHRPARSELVSARRAIHALAATGEYETYRDAGYESPPHLYVAKPGHHAGLATLRREKSDQAFRAALASGLFQSGPTP